MKNKPKSSNGPDTPFVRSLKTALHLLRLVGFTVALLCLLALFHLVTLGLPNHLTQQITARAREAGIPLQIDSIRLSLRRGWVLENVRFYSPSPDDIKPLLRTKSLYVFLWPDNWAAPSKGGWHVSLYAKKSEVSLGNCWEATLNSGNPFSSMDWLDASFHIQPGRLLVKDAELRWGGVRIHANGQALFADKPSADKPAVSFPEIGSQAAQIANFLAKLQFETEPKIDLFFNLNTSAPEENTVAANCLAEGLLWNGRTYDRLDANLSRIHRKINLSSIQIAQRTDHCLTARGSFDLNSRLAELNLKNSLHADDLLALFPPRARNNFDRLEIRPLGPFDVEASFGPAPPKQLLDHVRAHVSNAPMTRKDLTLDPFQFKITRDGKRLSVVEAKALANGGPMEGTFDIDLASLAWSAVLRGTIQPGPIGTLTGGGLKKFIDRFRFPNNPPAMQIELSHNGTKGSLKMEGSISGEDFFCVDVPFENLQTTLAWNKRQLTLDPLHATHEEKEFDGEVQIDFANKTARFDVTTGFDPRSIARIIAPEHPTPLEHLVFAGPVTAQGEGQVDFGAGTNNAFRGTLLAEKVSTDLVQMDRFNSRIEGLGSQLLFTNTLIDLHGGQAEGSAAFDLAPHDKSAPYRIQASARQINLASILQHAGTNDHTRTRGILSGTLDLTADGRIGFWATAKGRGQVNVKKGHLANLPVLRGLSRIIQHSFPGFKLFSISTFFAEYELGGGKLRSDNIQLGGTLLSAKAKGSYSPKDGFNVRLRAEPLRQTRKEKEWYQLHLWGAEVLKKGASPLFNLLDISLEGTLQDPQWRLLVVPKEIYRIIAPPGTTKP